MTLEGEDTCGMPRACLPGAGVRACRPIEIQAGAHTREQDEVQGAEEEVRDPEDDGLRTNAAGVANATTNMAAAAAKTANRTAPSSGSTVFVSQAYVPTPTPTTARQGRSAPRSSPSPVSLAARKPVTWVMAKTKTRSKTALAE